MFLQLIEFFLLVLEYLKILTCEGVRDNFCGSFHLIYIFFGFVMHETDTLKNSLRKALKIYKAKRPHLSVRAIAKKSGVNRYFLTKLLDSKDKTSSLDLNQVLILSKYITGKDSITEAIDASANDIREVLLKVFSADYENNKKVVDSSVYESVDLTDKTTYFVLVLATFGLGTKKIFISKILGERGENVLAELLKNKILREEKGRIQLFSGTDFTYDFKIMAQRIPDYLGFYRPERNGKQENYIHVLSEGVNLKTLREIRKIHLSAYKKITKLLAEPENWGDIPLFSFACLDRLSEEIVDIDDDENSSCGS